MKHKIFLIILCVSSLWQILYAQQEIWAKITAGATRKKISIVIADFLLPSIAPELLSNVSKNIKQVISDDLGYSLYFEIVPMPIDSTLSTYEKRIDFNKWSKIGAQVLLAGDIQIKKRTILNIRLYDLFSRRLIGTKGYEITENYRWLAHKIADDVIKLLTGEEGINQTQIAFSIRIGKNKELARVDYDGFNFQQLTKDGGYKLFPDWSPLANKIAFCSYAKNNLNIYTYDLNKDKIDLFCGKDGLNTTPAYSPDGKTIALSLTIDGTPDIYLMNADGKNLRRLTYGHSIDISPTWSPSGRELAFVSDRTGTPQIYIINVDGTNMRRLTFEGSYNTSPAWSPRGDLIAFVSRVEDGTNQIFITDLTGDNRMRLTSLRNNEEPSWSPDGLHIAFSSNRTGTYEIWTMHWNGTGLRQITNVGGAFSPTWSPRLLK
ncbi:MAG: Tol-Pal system beta propeller repeat protein TolB [candidate division WOR-3 bacterium]|nr:Tol-Pal system beta propeller repeat protein TolB [candidate division WOR-3 bacterium]